MLQQADWYTTYLEIRERYPNPKSYLWTCEVEKGDYCILDAVYLYFTGKQRPRGECNLETFFPNLTPFVALEFSSNIMGYNDSRHMEEAWSILAEAMSL